MTLGTKIKEYRTKRGLTQKELAEKLHVTYQAVSRWENGDVEPSVDTILEMTKIFDCSVDELFGKEKTPAPEPEVKVVEKMVVRESKPILALCEECNKPIYNQDEIFRIEKKIGSGKSITTQKVLLCKTCYSKWETEQAKQKEAARRNAIEQGRKRRTRSFIWPTVIAIVVILIGVIGFVKGNIKLGIGGVVCGVLSFPFTACLFLDNTFLPEMWLEIASWGFVKMPGVIFGFSLGGFVIGIAIKIFLWIVGLILAFGAVLLATGIGLIVGVFVYPVALKRSFRATEEEATKINDIIQ